MRASTVFGGVFSFVGDVAKGIWDVGSDVVDVAADAKDWVAGAAQDVGSSINKLTGTPAGGILVGAISFGLGSAAFVGLAPLVGPQVASAAFAVPGVLEGKPADKAWVQGLTSRVVMLANYYTKQAGGEASAAAAPVQQYVQDVTNALNDPRIVNLIDVDAINRIKGSRGLSTAEALKVLNLDPESLRSRVERSGGPSLRLDVFADVLNQKLGEQVYDTKSWNPVSGNPPRAETPGQLGVPSAVNRELDGFERAFNEAAAASASSKDQPQDPPAFQAVPTPSSTFARYSLTSSSPTSAYIPPAIVPQTDARKIVATALVGVPTRASDKWREMKLTAVLLAPSLILLTALRMRTKR